jgi:hypothetical protein
MAHLYQADLTGKPVGHAFGHLLPIDSHISAKASKDLYPPQSRGGKRGLVLGSFVDAHEQLVKLREYLGKPRKIFVCIGCKFVLVGQADGGKDTSCNTF